MIRKAMKQYLFPLRSAVLNYEEMVISKIKMTFDMTSDMWQVASHIHDGGVHLGWLSGAQFRILNYEN